MAGKVLSAANLKKAYRYYKKNGMQAMLYAGAERICQSREKYEKRILTEKELEAQRNRKWEHPESFSILVPAYETDPVHFHEMIDSVLAQTYTDFELIVADAGETDKLAEEMQYYKDERIRYIRLAQNNGISENTNEALKLAKGSYTGLLDHDDTLEADALYRMMEAIDEARRSGGKLPWLLYSDEDKGNGDMTRFYEPHRKPDFNLDLLLGNNYICHFLVMKTGLMKKLRFRKAYDGAQDHDLVLRAAGELLSETERIVHVPAVLYHWRCHDGSTAENPQSKMYAYEAGRKAVFDFCKSRGWQVKIMHTKHLGFFRIEYKDGILSQRSDAAAVGGRILSRGRIVGGAYEKSGKIMYQGLPEHFGGYMHRAVMQQDVWAVDVRKMEVREELKPVLDKLRQEGISEEQISLRFGQEAAKRGFLIVWDPFWEG